MELILTTLCEYEKIIDVTKVKEALSLDEINFILSKSFGHFER